jgi:diguanylate cyclase (GGDEF)-like protein/PAS domain S-box-containing protein
VNSTLARVGWCSAALAVAALLLLHSSDPGGDLGNATYLIAVIGAPIVAAVAVWQRRGDRLVGVLITSALAVSAVGDVVWQVYDATLAAAPDVSVADLGWLSAYGFLGCALLVLVRRSDYRLRRDPDSLIDMSVVAVLVALAVWMLWVSPTLADTTTPMFVRTVWALYPLLDATLLALLARMLLHRTVSGPAVALLASGLGLWLVSDAGYAALASWPWAETTMNIGWMLGSLLMAAAVWTFRDVDARTVARRRSVELARPVRRWRVVLAVVPLALPWGIELWAFRRGWDVDPVPLVIASVALAGLVCARTLHLLRLQRDTEQLYRAAAEHSSDATLIVSRDGLLLQDAPGLRTLLRDERAGAAGTSMTELAALTPGGRVWLDDVVGRVLERPGAVVEQEVRIRTDEDGDAWLFVRVVNLLDSPGVNAVLVNVHDITDRKAVEAALEHQAFHDPLTGLPNRALFADRLRHSFEQRARTGMDPAVLFLDLDHFKSVNDRLGHDAGDDLLIEVARRLRVAVRSGDSLARLGGDEFAVLIEHSSDALVDARNVADRILAQLAAPTGVDRTASAVTASIGIAPGSAASSPTALLRDADIAMYHAKASGRGRAVVYSSEMRQRDELRIRVEADLPNAVASDQMRVEYQPVVDLASGRISGFEALLRWAHPTYGEVSPEVFIPIAEQSGAIHEIGAWVLGTACRQLGSWQRDLCTDLTVAVNLSGRQLADPQLPGIVVRALETNDLAPAHLVLEITETALIGDTDEARSLLARLRQLGVRFAIDDFGTGYSSLSYLQHLPIDILKIDRSFVNDIGAGGGLPDIVRGILDLAHTLRLRTIAEGIEHAVQLDQLRTAGCDEGQGFLFARSLSADAATAMLHERGLTGTPVASS